MRKTGRFHGRVDDGALRACEAPGCEAPGEFRAPRGRGVAGHHWFCLEHVRAYNASWDYCAGMSRAEIDRLDRASYTWERGTWPLGGGARYADMDIDDVLDIFSDAPGFGARFTEAGRRRRGGGRLNEADLDALAVLDLDAGAGAQDIRSSYKRLVRRFHPDANGGDRSQEGRLRAVIAAYKHLMRERGSAAG